MSVTEITEEKVLAAIDAGKHRLTDICIELCGPRAWYAERTGPSIETCLNRLRKRGILTHYRTIGWQRVAVWPVCAGCDQPVDPEVARQDLFRKHFCPGCWKWTHALQTERRDRERIEHELRELREWCLRWGSVKLVEYELGKGVSELIRRANELYDAANLPRVVWNTSEHDILAQWLHSRMCELATKAGASGEAYANESKANLRRLLDYPALQS